MAANPMLLLADFLEDLSCYGKARSIYHAETAHHTAQFLRHLYLARLGITAPPALMLQNLDDSLRPALALQQLEDDSLRRRKNGHHALS